jgi:hypothetical protein
MLAAQKDATINAISFPAPLFIDSNGRLTQLAARFRAAAASLRSVANPLMEIGRAETYDICASEAEAAAKWLLAPPGQPSPDGDGGQSAGASGPVEGFRKCNRAGTGGGVYQGGSGFGK